MPHGQKDFWYSMNPGLPTLGGGQTAWFMSQSKEVPLNDDLDLISYVVPDDMELCVCSGIVSCKAPRTQRFRFITIPAGDWVSPTSHIDPDNKWVNEEKAYDKVLWTPASSFIDRDSWSAYLVFLVNEATIDKIKFYAFYRITNIDEIDIDVYYEGAWHDIYEGAFLDEEWVEKDIPDGAQLVSKARVRLHNIAAFSVWGGINEFMFNTAEETAQEAIYFDTYAIIPYLPEAPYPVPAGATFVLRVFNDDEDKQYMSANLAGFLQKKK